MCVHNFAKMDFNAEVYGSFDNTKYGKGNGNTLQYSCLENPMDRGAWWATVHGAQRVRHDWVTSLHFTSLWESTPSLFDPWGDFLRLWSQRGFLDLKSNSCDHLLYSSRAQLLPLTLSLACLGKIKFQFTSLDKPQLLRPGAHLPPTSFSL